MELKPSLNCRALLQGSAALALTTFAAPVRAQAPAATAITPSLIDAAKKEGKVAWYTSVDLPVAERVARDFRVEISEHRLPRRANRRGAPFSAHRTGSQQRHPCGRRRRVFRRGAFHCLETAKGLLTPYFGRRGEALSGGVQGCGRDFARFARSERDGIQHQPRSSPRAPNRIQDLLDPQWVGKIAKSHPSYSGTSMTGTYPISSVLAGIISRNSRNRRSAVAIVDRYAEEACDRRTRRHGGRQRYNMFHLKEQKRRSRSSMRKRERRSSSARMPCSRMRQIPTPHGCSKATASRPAASNSSSTSAASAPCIHSRRRSRDARRSTRSRR